MSGAGDVTVVWVAPGTAAGAEAPSQDAQSALAEWARARGITVRAPAGAAGSASVTLDLAVATRVEQELDRSREAIAAADTDAAERALARAESLLREHPELPQAAWLRAEVNRSWASRWTRLEPRDEQRAQIAWQDADALDGGRATGIGEVSFPARARTPVAITVSGAGGLRTIARLDGTELTGGTPADGATTYTLDVAPAEHQLVVTVDGDPVFASWLTVTPSAAASSHGPPSPAKYVVRVGDDGACSSGSLTGVSRDGTGAVSAPGVTCDRWVAATPAARRGAILVARCAGSACGPFVEWRSRAGFDGAEPGGGGATGTTPGPRHGSSWPGWATWTAVGVGAVAATTLSLIATGVFESRKTEERFVAGGVRIE